MSYNDNYKNNPSIIDNTKIPISIPSCGEYARYGKNSIQQDETIDEKVHPKLNTYKKYLMDKQQNKAIFFNLIEEFLEINSNSDELLFGEYINYLIDNHKIAGDRMLYSHLIQTLDYMADNNLIHINKKKMYIEPLSQAYYSNNAKCTNETITTQYEKIDYSKFYDSTSKKVTNNQVINELYADGGELYINVDGKFCLKLSKAHEPIVRSKTIIEGLLSRHFGFKIKITDDVPHYRDIDIDDFIFKSNTIGVINVRK